ncbi:hypothetical protein B0H13DRAFT_2670736 [Mycena leptocephala]|nr:hypothetical protein B0H13DRAFT_2670736 [Mycena leptocephala]
MPTLQPTTTPPSNPSPMAPLTAATAGMITIAGHLYTAAQVHAFLKGAAILAVFLLFSYLALVTVPKMLAPSPTSVKEQARALTPASTQSSPETPFAPRPCASPRAPARSASHRRHTVSSSAKASPPRPRPRPLPHFHLAQHPSPLSPTIWAALAHLHRAADLLVGAHPGALPLAARLSQTTQSKAFPWVPSTHVFGLVRPRLSPGGKATKPAAVLLLSSVPSSHSVGAPGKAIDGTQIEGKNSDVKIKRRPFSFVLPNGVLRSAPAKPATGKKGNSEDVKKGGAGKENAPAPAVIAPTNSN